MTEREPMSATTRPSGNQEAEVVLAGRRVALQPIVPQDYDALYRIELSADLGPRWRHQGATPSFEQFCSLLWQGVLAQFMVVALEPQPMAIGYVTAYDADLRDSTVHVAVAKFTDSDTSGRVMEGLGLFVNYLFHSWPLRHVYAQSTEDSYSGFRSGAGTVFEEYGTYPQRTWRCGSWQDVHILGCDRERWDRWGPIVMRRICGTKAFEQPGGDFVASRHWAEGSA